MVNLERTRAEGVPAGGTGGARRPGLAPRAMGRALLAALAALVSPRAVGGADVVVQHLFLGGDGLTAHDPNGTTDEDGSYSYKAHVPPTGHGKCLVSTYELSYSYCIKAGINH